MTALYRQIVGENKRDLVLLHGWGLNIKVWRCIQTRLTPYFCLHLIDLPGYGRSQGFGAMSLEQIAEKVLASAPPYSCWLGWSLGGLVASQAALMQPHRIRGLITVASSPCFTLRKDWPGIHPDILIGFQNQLSHHFQCTVKRFLALQTLGVNNSPQDACMLKELALNQLIPTIEVLNSGLKILLTSDLRQSMVGLSIPMLRIYGYLDGLVPRKIAERLDIMWPCSTSVVVSKAAHAPFISHPDEFTSIIVSFNEAY